MTVKVFYHYETKQGNGQSSCTLGYDGFSVNAQALYDFSKRIDEMLSLEKFTIVGYEIL